MTDSDIQPPAARIVTAGRIVTMTADEPQALAIQDGWVAATGALDSLRERFPGAEVVDLGTATVVPGFNDAHQHPTICAEQSLQVDLSPDRVAGVRELAAALRARATGTPEGDWIVGFGYDPFRTHGPDLTRDHLDAACPHHPTLVVHVTLHTGVLNTPALRLAGLRTPDDAPSGGVLSTDASGRINGVVHDQALYDIAFPAFTRRRTIVPAAGTAELQRAFTRFVDALHAAGITSVGDALVGPSGWELLHGLDIAGELSVRVNALGAFDHFDYFRQLDELAPAGNRLRLGGIKAFADGAVNGGTCLVDEPVVGGQGHGFERVSASDMNAIVRDVHEAGWRVCVHANGDRAIRYVLDAVTLAQEACPRADPRHRIEHASIVNREIIGRMREQHVVAVPFANYALAHGDKLRQYYELDRQERMFAHRSMLDAGIPVAGSSDYPCGPYEPLFAMQSCVTRLDRSGSPFGSSQRIGQREALALFTTGSAYASGEEATKGRLAPGYLADFVVLGADPLAVEPDRLAAVPVLETWIGGERVWSGNA